MAVLPELSDARTACADGRRFVAAHLARWQVPAQVSDEAVLLTSELIANAIRHSGQAATVGGSTVMYARKVLHRTNELIGDGA